MNLNSRIKNNEIFRGPMGRLGMIKYFNITNSLEYPL